VITPALFLGIFGATLLFFRLGHVVHFSHPGAFWLLCLVPWLWWLHFTGYGGLYRLRAQAALMARLVVLGGFVLLLAGPHAVRSSDRLAVVYLLDLSDSIGEKAVDRALEYVLKTVSRKPSTDAAGLVVFGRNAGVELPPRTTFPYEAINVRVLKDGTNLEKALSLAAALAPEDQPARIVLVSDGSQTEGNLTGLLDELKARRIPVDVLPIEYQYDREVWLERLDLPVHVKSGETYEASIVLTSLEAGKGKLVLRENGQVIAAEDIEYRAGKNRYEMPIYLRGAGYYEYAATLEVPAGQDGRTENNVAVNAIYLEGKGKVLVVTDPEGDARDFKSLVGALRKAERLVEVKPAFEFPNDAALLLPYHAVIFVNVPADAFSPPQMTALHDAVYGQGTGFLMVGGENSFGPGGYHRTPVEQVLPVTMDIPQKKILPKGALAIILHTCEFGQGNTWAKRITKAAIKVLGSEDEVGVLACNYNGRAYWVFKMSPAWAYEDMVTVLNSAELSDMQAFGPSMSMGLAALEASDASMKHMIIISDGDPSAPTPRLLARFQKAAISVSTVAVFPHGNQVTTMKHVAAVTGGRFYFPQNASLLPRIFIKEAKTLRRNLIQNKTFTPATGFPSPVLKGFASLPPLHGHVLTTPKPRTELILEVPDADMVEPVLAAWRYGLGRTAAFTSDLSTNWGRDWVSWDRYQAFVQQLVADVSRSARSSSVAIRSFASGTTGVVLVEDISSAGDAGHPSAAIRDPGGNVTKLSLEAVAPGRYRGTFPIQARGRYQVMVTGAGGERAGPAVDSLVVPYSAEYLRFRADPLVLRRVAERTGGRVLTGDEAASDIFVEKRETRRKARPVFDWFLILLAILIPLDVALRRIQLDYGALLALVGLDRREVSSGETLTGLLRRKLELKEPGPAAGKREPAEKPGTAKPPPPPAEPVRTAGPAESIETGPREAAPSGSDQETLSTTGRLLELKRKRKEKDET